MNANRKMSKAEMLRQPKKETKGGKRKQKMFLRKAIARKLKVPASSLKGKTFEELIDILDEKKIPLKEVVKGYDFEDDDEEQKEEPKKLLVSDADLVEMQSIRSNLLKLGLTKEQINKMSEKQKMEILQKVGAIITEAVPTEKFKEAMIPKKGKITETRGEIKKMKTKRPKEPRRTARIIQPAMNKELSDVIKAYEEAIADTDEDIFEPEEGKYDRDSEDDLDQAEVWQYPALGIAPNANLEVPNSSLNANMIRSVNSRRASRPDPLVPVRQRYEPARREVLEDNENMRDDRRPYVIPQQDILEQVRILEGPEGQMPHGEPHRLPNPVVVNDPRLAQNNMGSMEQNVMMNRNMMDRRELRRSMFGEGEEGKYDDAFGAMPEDDDFHELDQNEDIYNEEFEGMSNRERIDEMKKIMSYQQAGRWNGNMGVGRDYARSALVLGSAPTIDTTDRMRKEGLYPYKIPNRTYAGNAVNLIRNSNRSMLLKNGQLLP
jgi:hypothetical protein